MSLGSCVLRKLCPSIGDQFKSCKQWPSNCRGISAILFVKLYSLILLPILNTFSQKNQPLSLPDFKCVKLQLHDAIYRLRFLSNSLIHILSLSNSHNNVASIQKNRGDKSHHVIVALIGLETAAFIFRTKQYSTSYSSHICNGKRFCNDSL